MTQLAPRLFEKDVLVRFKHCDPAGIVFYPRYFEMVNDLIEDWFAQQLDFPFGTMHGANRTGIPTVSIDCRFVVPSRVGDLLLGTLAVTRLGHSSVSMRVRLAGRERGETRVELDLTVVFMDLDALRAIAIPEAVAARIRPFIAPAAPAPLPGPRTAPHD